MEINIIVDDYSMNLEVTEAFMASSGEAFRNLDALMDNGYQMGREWVEMPDRRQRCQIAASKLLVALETDNETLALLSAGYILNAMPGVRRITIDTSGEMSGTGFT